MTAGDLNKTFGWIWLLILLPISLLLGMNMNVSALIVANRPLHAHSGLLAFLNILYGLSIDAVPISDKIKRIGSMLAILGTILVTIGFYSFQFESILFFGVPLILVAIGIMAYGQLKKMKLKNE